MKRAVAAAVLVALGAAATVAADPLEAGLPFLRAWAPRDYGAQAQNWAAAQDHRGVVYVANSGGVLEFDGMRWRLIPTANRTIARSLAVDEAGRMWVGAVGDLGYLEADGDGQMEFRSVLDRVPPEARAFSDVFQTLVTPRGIVFASFERLLRLRGDEVEVFTPDRSFHFAFHVRGRTFVREEGRGLLELRDDGLALVPGGERFADERIYAMLPWGSSPQAILVGSRTRGLFVLEDGFRPLPTEIDAGLKRDLLFSGVRLPDGGVALGTIQGGAYLLDAQGRPRGRLDKARGLPDDCVWGQFVDREGGLWLALDRGIARAMVGAPLTRFDDRTGLPGMVITIHRHAGDIYVGTGQGAYRLEPGPEAHFRAIGIPNQTWAFLSLGDTLLVANNDGVHEVRGGVPVLILKGDGASALLASRATPGRVFVGLTEGLASLRNDGAGWVDEGPVPGVTGDVRRIVEMPDGRLWVGTQVSGVLRVTFPPGGGEPVVERYGVEHGLPSPNETMVYPVAGQALFGTRAGLFRFDEARRRFVPHEATDGLHPDGPRRVTAVCEDRDGRIWMNTQDDSGSRNEPGAVVRDDQGRWGWQPRSLGLLAGSSAIWTTWADADGVLWFGGDDGLFRYDPGRPGPAAEGPDALVRRVRRAGSDAPLRTGAAPVLDWGQNALRFEYAAPAFDAPEATLFQVLLEGNDTEWSPWTREGFREYTNLREGSYRFRVRARRYDGAMGAEATWGFRILPPWYRTTWARLGALAGALVLGWAIVSWRVRRMEAERRALEATVAERTREVRERNDQLETLNAIVKSINERLDFDDLLLAMLRECRVIRGMEKAAALVRLPERTAFTFRASLGFPPSVLSDVELELEEAEARYIEGAEEVSPDVFLIRGPKGRPGEAKLRLRVIPQALLVVRIRIDGQIEGYLVFENQHDEEAFDAHDLDLLRALREHFLSAFEKARSLRLLDRARRAAEDARLRAEEASRAKSEFLANMSHELRTPLHGVLGFAQLMDRAPDRSPADREHLATILRSGEHLLGLINDVLSLSRIEAGGLALRESPFDLAALVSGVAALVRVRAEAKDIVLSVEQGELPAAVVGDEGKLRQVLLNVLGNAVKFTERGRVTLRIRWAAGRAVFEVEDTGPGIPPAELAAVFEPFAQGEGGHRSGEGSGLGLPIAQRFARLMGGNVSVRSAVGVGSTFRIEVRLPDAGGERAPARADRRRIVALAPGQPGFRVLVVDDLAENRTLMRGLLAGVGFEVREARGGEEAIELCRSWSPHLVWMDKRMPGVDGLEATRRIRAEERGAGRPRVPIIALSASALEHERSQVLEAGCDDFVPKPFREGAILEKMAEHLRVRWTYDEAASTDAR